MKKVYSASNEPGMYFVGTPDEEDIRAYDMHEMGCDFATKLAAYADRSGISGWIELEMAIQPEGYYLPVIPN